MRRRSTVLARVSTVAIGAALLALAHCGSGAPAENTCNGAEALTVCPIGPVVHGVDVSYYQDTVDWAQAKQAGIDFGFARISDGVNSPDTKFAANWSAMKQAGVVRGAYQFFRPGQDPTAQAELALKALGNSGNIAPGDLPLVMDIEVTDSVPAATIRLNMQTWLDAIEKGTGRAPIVYTAPFMSATIGTTFAKYVLWVANYQVTCPTMPANWTSWTFWQTSGSGAAAGITGAVDLDDFNGTLADLLVFANGASKDGGTGDASLDGTASHDASADASSAPDGSIGTSGMSDSGASSAGSDAGGPGTPPCR